jgi:hypothetical protein
MVSYLFLGWFANFSGNCAEFRLCPSSCRFQICKLTDRLKTSDQGVTKRYHLSWLTDSALVYEPKCGGRGGVAVSQPMNKAVHRSPNQENWRTQTMFQNLLASTHSYSICTVQCHGPSESGFFPCNSVIFLVFLHFCRVHTNRLRTIQATVEFRCFPGP